MVSARKTIVSGAGVAAGFGLLLALCIVFSSDLLALTLFGKPELSPILSLLALGIPLWRPSRPWRSSQCKHSGRFA